MAGYRKLNGYLYACRYFCITFCLARRLATIDFKGLLHLMSYLFICFCLFVCLGLFLL